MCLVGGKPIVVGDGEEEPTSRHNVHVPTKVVEGGECRVDHSLLGSCNLMRGRRIRAGEEVVRREKSTMIPGTLRFLI